MSEVKCLVYRIYREHIARTDGRTGNIVNTWQESEMKYCRNDRHHGPTLEIRYLIMSYMMWLNNKTNCTVINGDETYSELFIVIKNIMLDPHKDIYFI